MYKFYSFISLLFFSSITLSMDNTSYSISISTDSNKPERIVNYGAKANQQKKTSGQEKKLSAPPTKNLFTSSKVTKPTNIRQEKQKHQFVYNEYTARRGEPKMLDIYCDECNDFLIRYQKDGPGRLLRCYLDRIHNPEHLKNRQYDKFNVRTSPNLMCKTCLLIIGKPMIYPSETRPAYKMAPGSFYFKESK